MKSPPIFNYKNLLILFFVILSTILIPTVLAGGNNFPLFSGVADFSLDEDFSLLIINLQDNVSDAEDPTSSLTFNWTLNDSSVFSLDIVNTTGIATFSSNTNAYGSVLVDISVVDTGGLSNSTEFTINIPHNDSCSNPYNLQTDDSCYVYSDTVFDGGTYYKNDSTGNGAIIIVNDNVNLDFNGTQFIGNRSTNSKVFMTQAHTNITVTNFNISDYEIPFYLLWANDTTVSNGYIYNNDRIIITNVDNMVLYNISIINSTSSVVGAMYFNTFVMNSNISYLNFENSIRSHIYSISNLTNTTIESCTFNTTTTSYSIDLNGDTTGNLINNNNFESSYLHSIKIYNGDGNTISNNRYYNDSTRVVDLRHGTNNIINRDNVLSSPSSATMFYILNETNDIIDGVTMSNGLATILIGGNTDNTTIQNVIINNETQYGIIQVTGGDNNNLYLINNTLNLTTRCITILSNSSNIFIWNTTCSNAITNYDGYNTGIQLSYNISNVEIIDTEITNYGTLGLLIQAVDNLTLTNDSFDQLPIADMVADDVRGYLEPPAAIAVLERYKSWYGDALETADNNNLSTSQNYASSNINITGITFGSNVQIMLRTQGTVNVTHDLTNYVYKKYQYPVEWVDADELYIVNTFTNISNKFHAPNVVNYMMGQDWMYGITPHAVWNMTNEYIWVWNGNDTETYTRIDFNMTKALIYSTNLSVSPQFSDINSNNGDLTYSVGGLQAFYVLPDLNITEGVTRENSPFVISSVSSFEKKITSNLTDTVNVSTTITDPLIPCSGLININGSSNSGLFTQNWSNLDFVCNPDDSTTFVVNNIGTEYVLDFNTPPWADSLPDVVVPENTGSFFAWLWDQIVAVWHDFNDFFPSSVSIVSQSNESVVGCSVVFNETDLDYNNWTNYTESGFVIDTQTGGGNYRMSYSDSSGPSFFYPRQAWIMLNSSNLTELGDNLDIIVVLNGSLNNVNMQFLLSNDSLNLENIGDGDYQLYLLSDVDNNSFGFYPFEFWINTSTGDYAFRQVNGTVANGTVSDRMFSFFKIYLGGSFFDVSIDNFTLLQGSTTLFYDEFGVNQSVYCDTVVNASGESILNISLTNSVGQTTSTTGNVTVTGVNDAPWFDPISNTSSIDENFANLNVSLQVPWQDSWHDVEDAYPSASALTSNNTELSCALTNGDIICSSLNNMTGAGALTIEANDTEGLNAWVSFDLLINHINQVPWIDQLANVTIEEDNGTAYLYTGLELNVSFRDVEEDLNPANTTISSQSNETVAVCSIETTDGKLQCDTQANASGETTITLNFVDSEGGNVNELITLTVNSVNDAPFVDWDSESPSSGSYFNFNVSFYFNVSDIDNETIDSCDLFNGTDSVGSLTNLLTGSNNSIVYNISIGELGSYGFFVQCFDGVNYSNSSIKTISTDAASEITGVSSNFTSPQYPGVSYFYELNLTFNPAVVSSFSGTLNWSNLTTVLSTELVNSTNFRLYATYVTPYGYDGTTVPYSFDVYIFYTNSSTAENQTIATGDIVVSSPSFALCNASLTDDYLIFNFLDESTNDSVDGQISFSSFYYSFEPTLEHYYYYSFTSAVDNNYSLCFEPSGQSIYVNSVLTYLGTGYPSRSYSKDGQVLSSVATTTTLALLPSGSGATVTFQVIDSVYGTPVSGVNVLAERDLGDSYLNVGNAVTDDSGVVTFFLNTAQPHRFTFTKSGYDTFVKSYVSLSSSAPYIVSMINTASLIPAILGENNATYFTGILYHVEPNASVLLNNTDYNFSLDLTNNGYYSLSDVGFVLFNSTSMIPANIIGSASCTGTLGCSASTVVNTDNFSWVVMNFYWISNGSVSNETRLWTVMSMYEGRFSIARFFTDLQRFGTYFDSPTDENGNNLSFEFTKALISLVIILLIVGGLTYYGGVYSPLAILGVIASIVTLLDLTNFLPATTNIFGANLITIIVWLFVGGYYASSRVMAQ